MFRRALVVTVVLLASPFPQALASNEVTRIAIRDLAGPGVEVRSINNGGVIVGAISTPSRTFQVPFRWTRARGVDRFLGVAPGYATDISDGGAIVGVLLDSSSDFMSGFLWRPHRGVVRLNRFVPAAINNREQIAGSCFEVGGVQRPCLWENGVVTELGDGVQYGAAFDVNEGGRVAGQLLQSAFVWSRRSGLRVLPDSSGGSNAITAAMAINDRSETVGFEVNSDVNPPVFIPVRWTRAGEMASFPRLDGTFVAINSGGLAVGRYEVLIAPNQFGWYGFASIHRQLVGLGPGIPVAVTDAGAILGTTVIDGTPQVVLWIMRGQGGRW